MLFPLYIARRYFFSKYTKSAVNLIAFVSMIAVTFVVAAMVIIMSSMNGFEVLVKSMYNSFYPAIKLQPLEGKTFTWEKDEDAFLNSIDEIISYSKVVEERALFGYGKKQYVGIIKGVDRSYADVSGIEEKIYKGNYILKDENAVYSILGSGVAARLSLDVEDPLARLKIYAPKKGFSSSAFFNQAFKTQLTIASAAFSIQQEIDVQYVLVDVNVAQTLMGYSSSDFSAIEIKVAPNDLEKVTKKLHLKYGEKFKILDRYQQNVSLYQVMKLERWAVYCIMSLILFIAAFNIGGFLIMLILEKRQDFFVFRSMGATPSLVRKIVFLEGILITGFGSLIGITVSSLVVLGQSHFGWLKLPGETFVVDAYPVDLRGADLLLIFSTVVIIAALTSAYPARLAAKKLLRSQE